MHVNEGCSDALKNAPMAPFSAASKPVAPPPRKALPVLAQPAVSTPNRNSSPHSAQSAVQDSTAPQNTENENAPLRESDGLPLNRGSDMPPVDSRPVLAEIAAVLSFYGHALSFHSEVGSSCNRSASALHGPSLRGFPTLHRFRWLATQSAARLVHPRHRSSAPRPPRTSRPSLKPCQTRDPRPLPLPQK